MRARGVPVTNVTKGVLRPCFDAIVETTGELPVDTRKKKEMEIDY